MQTMFKGKNNACQPNSKQKIQGKTMWKAGEKVSEKKKIGGKWDKRRSVICVIESTCRALRSK